MINFLTAFLMLCALPLLISAGYIVAVIIKKGAAAAWRKMKHEYLMTPKSVFYRTEALR